MGLGRSLKQLLILVLVAGSVQAQTRLYLNLNNVYQSTVAFNAGWHVTTNAVRYLMEPSHRDQSTIASRTSTQVGAVAVRKCLIDQWVSPPMAAQTTTGTLDGQIRFNCNSTTSTTWQGWIYVRVVNADNSIATEVGTITTSNLTVTLTNRTLGQLNVGTLNITAGQRFAIDVGGNMSVGTNTTRTVTCSRGSSSTTDLPVDNTATAANSPWIQFSQTIVWRATTTGHNF